MVAHTDFFPFVLVNAIESKLEFRINMVKCQNSANEKHNNNKNNKNHQQQQLVIT